MRLDKAIIEHGPIPELYVTAFNCLIEEKDWYANDPRAQMFSHRTHSEYNSILIRHSTVYIKSGDPDPKHLTFYPEHTSQFIGITERMVDLVRDIYPVSDYVAFLARLEPGGYIGEHIDRGSFLDTIHRIHIPLVTNPDCMYVVDDLEINMKVGTMYEIDNQRMHAVYNRGKEARVHLIINAYP